jgi:tRNA dimethylallyltransferase
LSHLQTQFDEGRPAGRVKVFVLSWPRDELHRRIDARVEQMFAAGLVEEVRLLLDRYGALSRTASQAVGYGEVIEYVRGQGTGDRGEGTGAGGKGPATERGRESLSEDVASGARTPVPTKTPDPLAPDLATCIERVKVRTRQFAKRQETWFRSLSECTFVPMHKSATPLQSATTILELAAKRKADVAR